MHIVVEVGEAQFEPKAKVAVKSRFVIVQFGTQLGTTRVEKSNPAVFGDSFRFRCIPSLRPALLVDAYCKSVTGDLYCGSLLVPTDTLVPNTTTQAWHKLSSGGRVRLSVRLVDA